MRVVGGDFSSSEDDDDNDDDVADESWFCCVFCKVSVAAVGEDYTHASLAADLSLSHTLLTKRWQNFLCS